jgi:hypothetical protein
LKALAASRLFFASKGLKAVLLGPAAGVHPWGLFPQTYLKAAEAAFFNAG